MSPPSRPAVGGDSPFGVLVAGLAFLWWGLFPLYFRLVDPVSPIEVIAHRVVWSFVFLAVLLGMRRQWAWLPRVLRQPKVLVTFAASALLIATNWLTYTWAIEHHHVVDSSPGYFVNPLLNVLLGTLVLRERPRPMQWLAVGIAALGVVWLTVQSGGLPWVALVLAISFAGYGLLRKISALGALEGLMLETILLGVPALGVLLVLGARGTGAFASAGIGVDLWLMALGPITAVPLLLFAAGARALSLSTLGLLQYIGPTIQLIGGVLVFGEPFAGAKAIGFVCIWLALAVYSADSWRAGRATSNQPARAPIR